MITEKNLTSAVAHAATVAKFVGLTSKRISQLASENKIPSPDADGKFPLAVTIEKYCAFLRSRMDVATITTARRRRLEAQASMSEMELGVKRKSLVPLAEVSLVWTARKTALRQIVEQSGLEKSARDEVLQELENSQIDDEFLTK